jgi:hypothetical protein
VKARPQPIEGFERPQPVLGHGSQLCRRVGQQVTDGARTTPSDPATQLVQLREPKAVGAPDQHRISAGHVEPVLDDVGR